MLIGLENRDAPVGAWEFDPLSLRHDNGESSLMAKPQVVTLVDAGSNPVVHPTVRRGGRAVQGARLLNERGAQSHPGSNPGLSATCP